MAKSPRTTKTPAASEGGSARRTTRQRRATETPPEATPAAPPNGAADRDAIARRAYEIYRSRGGAEGSDVEDWLEAERQLRAPERDDR
ncbi:MAG: DUF2934 domain-containing protein [Candidatus Rokubacteria bacterium]|nr:DUF2934 domain-containing protein [Candidatus Rokubacteria bacterium]